MGAWSHKPFENDEAEEFLALLQSDDGAIHLKSTVSLTQ